MGTSDVVLRDKRAVVAHAVAPPNAGKNPDLILLATDLNSGTVDPAFQDHIAPIKEWALAWWQSWQSRDRLQAAYITALVKLNRAKSSPWQRAAGPTAGYILTARRLGWSPAFDSVKDDLGFVSRFTVDSPAAIAGAVREAVKRWRIRRIAAAIPSMTPSSPDYDPSAPEHVLLPVVAPLEAFLHRNRATRTTRWVAQWSASLFSAMCGGQWPQARRARLKGRKGGASSQDFVAEVVKCLIIVDDV